MGRRQQVASPAPRFDGLAPSSARASAIAAAIRRRDTRPEVALRRALWRLGLRYRTSARRIIGRPDIVFTAARVVIFVDGDFWHGRNWRTRAGKLRRGSNASYWLAKIAANMSRDRRNNARLRQDGWLVLRAWESDVLLDANAIALRFHRVIQARRSSRSTRG